MDATDWNDLIVRPLVIVCLVAAMVAVAHFAERLERKDSQ